MSAALLSSSIYIDDFMWRNIYTHLYVEFEGSNWM